MRHGRTTAARPFTGYKLHAAADAEAPLVTSIALSPGNEHDGRHATLVDRQPEGRRPARVIGDTAYGNIEAREELAERNVAVLAPVHTTSPRGGTIAKDGFRIDLDEDTVNLPAGQDRADLQAATEPRPSKRHAHRAL